MLGKVASVVFYFGLAFLVYTMGLVGVLVAIASVILGILALM